MTKTGGRWIYSGMLLLQALFWGVGNPVIKIGMESLPAFCGMALRYTLALGIFLVLFGKRLGSIKREDLRHFFWISLSSAVSFITSTLSLVFTSATTAGFLMGLAVLFTPFLSYVFVSRQLDKRILVTTGVVILGMYFLCGGGSLSFGLGEILALTASLCFAVSLTYTSLHVSEMDPMALATFQIGITAVLAWLGAILTEDVAAISGISPVGWAAVLYLVVCGTALAYVMQNIALRHVSAVMASLALCAEPVFSAIASRLMLGEQLTLMGVIGALLITVGIGAGSLLSAGAPEENQEIPADTEEREDQALAGSELLPPSSVE